MTLLTTVLNTLCLCFVVLTAISCGILTVIYVSNPALAIAILVFALLVLLVTVPIFGLALRVLPATTWLRAYVELLGRIPGLRRVVHATGALRPSPNQLPNDLTDFRGRKEQIRELREFLTGGTRAVAGICGMPGVGKSALAVHLAHQLVDAAPDGRIYIDMSGTSPKPVTPLTPLAAMTRVIQILHPQEPVPVELELVQSRYRSCLADKRALLLLDNVDESMQVAPLLEWSAENTLIIITSRQAIPEATFSLELELMDTDEARDLLQAVLHGTPASQDQLKALAERCGNLPLALRTAGTFLAVNKNWDVEEYIKVLEDERNRPELLRFGGACKRGVYAVLSFSARQLQSEPELAELWRMLAVFPASFDRIAAAAVWSVEKDKARQALSNLLRRNMIMYDKANKRYRLHDLMRDVATLPFEDEDEGAVRQQQEEAAVRHARHFSGVLRESCNLYANGETAAALDLYDVEQRNIGAGQAWAVDNMATPNGHNNEIARLACDYAYHTHQLLALRLPSLERVRWLCGAFQASRLLDDQQLESHLLGVVGNILVDIGKQRLAIRAYVRRLEIARETRKLRDECEVLGQLGTAYQRMGRPRRAIEYLNDRLEIAKKINERNYECDTLSELGGLYQHIGEARCALQLYKQLLEIEEHGGCQPRVCSALGRLGSACRDLGERDQAIEYGKRRLDISVKIQDQREECYALGDLGSAYQDLRQWESAIECHERRLLISRELRDRGLEGYARASMGNAYAGLLRTEEAIDCHNQHLKIAQEIGDGGHECRARRNLGLIYVNLGQAARAIDHHKKQLGIARRIHDPRSEVTAYRDLGNAYLLSDEKQEAIACFKKAVAIAEEIGDQRGKAGALHDGGVALHQLGEHKGAVEWLKDALTIQERIEDPTAKRTHETLVQWEPRQA